MSTRIDGLLSWHVMAGKRLPVDEKRVITALRIRPDDLADITQRAKILGLTRTDYMIRCALRQPLGDEGYEERLEELVGRLDRLEERVFGGYSG